MNIPAHRAAAVEPTPADTFEVKDGKTINLSEQERAARAAAEQAEREKQQAAEAESAPDAAPPAELPKPAKAAGSAKATTIQTKEA
ncbi:hypothetical protein [Azospirillum brasilense]|uniref:Uncharacterized protein n=1 Tax=Azospirillum brasilense TaxID=192 RepID=A0A235HAG3_AZOBR|nr:hypothetical protein [Azospirillum brasilense]OYD82504.1 hypothetical protein CHT98_20095 [Azospirillum brasilense]